MSEVRDQLSRPLRDLRISVTDRCNFRCTYCMPAEIFGAGHAFLKDPQRMSFEELTRILRAFASLGVEKIRLTGGEPLLRADVPALIHFIKTELSVPDVALTTNGWLLEKYARALRAAGLDRLTVSLDSLDREIFGRMNGQGFGPERVIRGIDAALQAGFAVKLNMMVQRGVNDREIVPLTQWARARGLNLRFIEFMDAGMHNGWERSQVVPAKEIVDTLAARWPLEAMAPAYRGEVAARYRFLDGGGEIGLISAVTEPFCRDCNRARLSADGKIHTCLFTALGHDVLGALRGGADEAALRNFISRVWGFRTDRYSEERAERLARGEMVEKAEMSYLGG
jgi:cyclic pyranopterin phosphate synthase